MCNCSCYSQSCPEPVDVVINNRSVIISGLEVGFTQVSTGVFAKTYLLQVGTPDGDPVDGEFVIRIWFADSDSVLTPPSVVVPDVPGLPEYTVITASDGSYTLAISNSFARSWVVCAEVAGVISKQEVALI